VSLLLSLVFRGVCRTTHHRIAVDAVRHLRSAEAEQWMDMLLVHHRELLAGSMAPDERFGEFRSHVIHVAENYWGDAPRECRRWYGRTVDALRGRQWAEAAFAAGALSHYFSDPFMPLHTACSEEDTKVHRALEWSIGKSYGRLQHIIERDQGGYPQLGTPRADDWLEKMVFTGAELAHEHYAAVLAHFDLARSVRDPVAGMDQECQSRIASCLAHAVVGVARVLERAIAESEVEPPHVETTLSGFLAAASGPLLAAGHYVADLSERMHMEALLDEATRTGKVLHHLTASQREVRRLHAEEVLRVPLSRLDQQAAALTGTLYGTGSSEGTYSNVLRCDWSPPVNGDNSLAWREAQMRLKQRLGAAGHKRAA
jgi:hypothetical protein